MTEAELEQFNSFQVQQIDEKINEIDERIDSLNEFRLRNLEHNTIDVYNDLSSLRRMKNHYEREKYDIIHGTHKVQIKELENKIIYLSISLGEEKERLARASAFNSKKIEEQISNLEITIRELQKYSLELEQQDIELENNNISL